MIDCVAQYCDALRRPYEDPDQSPPGEHKILILDIVIKQGSDDGVPDEQERKAYSRQRMQKRQAHADGNDKMSSVTGLTMDATPRDEEAYFARHRMRLEGVARPDWGCGMLKYSTLVSQMRSLISRTRGGHLWQAVGAVFRTVSR